MISYKRVEQGDPFQPSAETWNILQEVARDYKTRNQFAGNSQRFTRSPVIVEVKNNSGADRSRFDILKVSGVVFGADDNLSEFQNRYVLTGETPASGDQIVVLQSAIPDGRVGSAVILGTTPCRVNVLSESHDFAVVKNSAIEFDSASSGPIRLIYKGTGTGTKDALGLLGSGGGGNVGLCEIRQTGPTVENGEFVRDLIGNAGFQADDPVTNIINSGGIFEGLPGDLMVVQHDGSGTFAIVNKRCPGE